MPPTEKNGIVRYPIFFTALGLVVTGLLSACYAMMESHKCDSRETIKSVKASQQSQYETLRGDIQELRKLILERP
jgi:hypothetical protein